MKRVVLFSAPENNPNLDKILDLIFPRDLNPKIGGYMPSGGANSPAKYIDQWKNYFDNHQTEFKLIDNTSVLAEEKEKLLGCNILVISGGNTFTLLNNLKTSGLDQTIKEFAQKNNFVLAGFSAGAIVLSPTIEICNLPDFDENKVGLKDLTGLGIIDFDVFPHYEEKEQEALRHYQEQTKSEVKTITNEGYLVINS